MTAENTEVLPTWDLSDLYAAPDDAKLESDMEAVQARAAAFAETYRDGIDRADLEPARLKGALEEYEAIIRAQYKPQAYAQLLFSTDTRSQIYQKVKQKSIHQKNC